MVELAGIGFCIRRFLDPCRVWSISCVCLCFWSLNEVRGGSRPIGTMLKFAINWRLAYEKGRAPIEGTRHVFSNGQLLLDVSIEF